MKLSAAIEGMLHMCTAAWRIFLRCLQLSCFLLFCAVLLLIAWDGDHIRDYDLFCLSSVLQEMAQLSLLFGVIIPPCVEDLEKKAP